MWIGCATPERAALSLLSSDDHGFDACHGLYRGPPLRQSATMTVFFILISRDSVLPFPPRF
jgi:hypothetical protein